MFVAHHLQQQLHEHQKYYDLLSAKLQKLRTGLAIETDPAISFKLEYHIKEITDEREKIAQAVDTLERADRSANLHRALLKLNYHKQVDVFYHLLDKSQVGAFLIHGKPDYGQNWLLNRLVRRVLQNGVGKVIPVNLGSRRRWNFEAIIREIGRHCADIKNAQDQQSTIEQIHCLWQTQTVILIFHNVDAIDIASIQDLMQKFWLPLVDKTLQYPSRSPTSKLLLFLVDDYGCIDTWPFDCVEHIDLSWKPHIPIKPPGLTPIHTEELLHWIRFEFDELPSQMRGTQIEDILRNSQEGTPQFVLEYICKLCDCDWSELEERWITY